MGRWIDCAVRLFRVYLHGSFGGGLVLLPMAAAGGHGDGRGGAFKSEVGVKEISGLGVWPFFCSDVGKNSGDEVEAGRANDAWLALQTRLTAAARSLLVR
jgi:hypothetical protein